MLVTRQVFKHFGQFAQRFENALLQRSGILLAAFAHELSDGTFALFELRHDEKNAEFVESHHFAHERKMTHAMRRDCLNHFLSQVLHESQAADEEARGRQVLLELCVVRGVAQLFEQVARHLAAHVCFVIVDVARRRRLYGLILTLEHRKYDAHTLAHVRRIGHDLAIGRLRRREESGRHNHALAIRTSHSRCSRVDRAAYHE